MIIIFVIHHRDIRELVGRNVVKIGTWRLEKWSGREKGGRGHDDDGGRLEDFINTKGIE